jgi:hypothetical protein
MDTKNPLQLLHTTEERLNVAIRRISDEQMYVSDYMGANSAPAQRLKWALDLLESAEESLQEARKAYLTEIVGNAHRSQEAVHNFVSQALKQVTK